MKIIKRINLDFILNKSFLLSVLLVLFTLAIAIILSVAFLGEPLTIKTALGALMIIGGTLVLIF